MLNRRWRPVVVSALVVIGIWIAALTGYSIAKRSRVTVERVRAYVQAVDLSRLSPEERRKALRKLADMLNALSLEERQKARLERLTWEWFGQLPEDKRRKTVDDALRRLRDTQNRIRTAESEDGQPVTKGPPVLSDELQAKIRTIGLNTFYSQSSAQTKAELAPVLEELQRVMESGRPFQGR
jgi:acyl-CoA reductase-like NAD-dependent aldehyde dehydrogenase